MGTHECHFFFFFFCPSYQRAWHKTAGLNDVAIGKQRLYDVNSNYRMYDFHGGSTSSFVSPMNVRKNIVRKEP